MRRDIRFTTPALMRKVIAMVQDPSDRDFVLADLETEFLERVQRSGIRSARQWYRRQVLHSVVPGVRYRIESSLIVLRHRWHGNPKSNERAANFGTTRRSHMSHLITDIRDALRSLRKTPVGSVVIIASLAIGVAATTVVFTVSNALFFRTSAHLETSEHLASIYTSGGDGGLYGSNSFPDYLDILGASASIEDAAAIRLGALTMGSGNARRPLFAEIVTGNYFDVLGINLPIGRRFLAEETTIGSADRVVVISHRLWMDRFSGSTSVAGETIRLDGHDFTVIGVAPDGLLNRMAGLRVDLWVPLGIPGGTFRATPDALRNRGDRDFMVVARMADATANERAQNELALLSEQLFSEHPTQWADDRDNARVFSILSDEESRVPPPLKKVMAVMSGLLFTVAGMILLIACTNVAGIFMAKASQRRREMAVRLALGAGRRRLISMLITESTIPALLGGFLGVLIAQSVTGSFDSINLPMGIPLEFDFRMDYRVLAFALLVSLGSSLVFGLAPALEASKPDLVPSLKGAATSSRKSVRRFGLRNILVVGQVASSLVLMIVAGLAMRTMQGFSGLDLGFDTDRIAIMSKKVPGDPHPRSLVQYVKDLRVRLAEIPGVEDVQISGSAEATFTSSFSSTEIQLPGQDLPEAPRVANNVVTPGYLEMLNLRFLRGRSINEADAFGSRQVAVVTNSFAERFWPDEAALGQTFTAGDHREGEDQSVRATTTYEVVGVVGDGMFNGVGEEPQPYYWTSYYQEPMAQIIVHLRGRITGESMIPVLRSEIEVAENEIQLILPTTFAALTSLGAAQFRMAGQVLAGGGLFGLILVAVGIYGIVSLAVTQRAKEMAIRQAIGARQGQIVRKVAREGLVLTLVGSLVGLLIIVPLARFGETAVYGVAPLDPYAFGISISVMLTAAFLASAIPARRIVDVDPMEILREE